LQDKLAALSNELGGNIPYTVCDASKPDTIESIIATALSSSSSGSTNDVNGLVYAIGTIPLKPLRSTTYQDYVDTYNVNFTSAALAVKAATPALTTTAKANSSTSSVVLFSSVAASVGFPNHTAIGAAKGTIEAFVRTSAAELSPFVRINAIAPSLTDTPLASRLLSTDAMKQSLGGMLM
jgi:NAD(P)-dependent dehydrogenase (short-subunit alcohol dehydrogenase family)